MKVLLVGPPGAIKRLHGRLLAQHFEIQHIVAGDLLRAEIRSGTSLGAVIRDRVERGVLVSDDLAMEALAPTVLRATRNGGYVLDGFPRTVPQARVAERIAAKTGRVADIVLGLRVPNAVLIPRLLARAQIEGRARDTLPTIKHKLQAYEQATRPLLEHFRQRALVVEIDAAGHPHEVARRACSAIERLIEPRVLLEG